MPVRRFRSVEEMNQPRWRKPGDPELYAAIAALWRLGARTGQRRFPPGVHKHRSISDKLLGRNAMSEDDPLVAAIERLVRSDNRIVDVDIERET